MTIRSIAIIGGGPGGLLTARRLQQLAPESLQVDLYEAAPEVGGKVLTRQFSRAPVSYEAGAAELYDYSAVGPDPLRELVAELGLGTFPMRGDAVILDGRLYRTSQELNAEARRELKRFSRFAREAISPAEYYESDWRADLEDPLARASFRALLNRLRDPLARRYIETAIHSDLATEPHRTSAAYGLQNWLMNEPGYMSLYGIRGGNQRLVRELARRLHAGLHTRHRVTRLRPLPDHSFELTIHHPDGAIRRQADAVVVALPVNAIRGIAYDHPALDTAVLAHHRHFDHPAHYLRISTLFRTPFWRKHLADSYFMHDAFGGCCLYDESDRDGAAGHGVIGWLLGGEAAATHSNQTDDELIRTVLESWPAMLGDARAEFLEARVTRWIGTVNALPGGRTPLPPEKRHQPDPVAFPNFHFVGDYLFDSTLNGVMDSAEWAAETIVEDFPPSARK
ncbi:MAG: FAD-dependent oxidoreductase [Gemmataceae bacterium]